VAESELWRLEVQASDTHSLSNHWDLWIAPRVQADEQKIFHHSSLSQWLDTLRALPACQEIKSRPWDGIETKGIILTRRWDRQLWQAALAGARVVMLPENTPGSLAVREHWFLRGGPIHGPEHSFWKHYSRSMLSDIQHFDWSGPVIFDSPLFSAVTPIAFLWDNHDLKSYRSHLLAFDCRVGNGRWLASTLGMGKQPSITHFELLQQYIRCIADDSVEVRALSREWLESIASEIDSKAKSLADAKWVFRPDERNLGVKEKWFDSSVPKNDWAPITIDKHWEAHGYESLDGWAWYYTAVDIPEELKAKSAGESLFMHFTGADDYFELFVDGELIGSGGDPELKQTAFELRKSFILPESAVADGKLEIAVRIQDWQGAGGLFRPIFIGNRPIREQAPVLVESR